MPTYRVDRGDLQHRFMQSRAKIQLFCGAYANGKTTGAIVTKVLPVAEAYPGAEILVARATYPKLNDTIRKVFYKWCPDDWIKKRHTQDDNTCYLHNGSNIQFRYVAQRGKKREDGTTTSNLLSATYDLIVIDQIEDPEITYKDFLDLLGRLRGSTVYRPNGPEDVTMPDTGPRWLVATANPSHNWFYREIVHPYILFRDKGIRTEKLLVDPETGNPLIEMFEGDIYSNAKHLAPDFIRTQEAAYKGQMRERYVLGKWAAFEGLVHPSYERHVHMLAHDDIMAHLQDCLDRHVKLYVIEGYDFGISARSCYMLAVVDDWGRVFIIDGFYEREFNIYEQPAEIEAIRESYAALKLKLEEPINADPAIFRRTVVGKQKGAGEPISKILRDGGIRVRPANNEVLAGIAKVNGYLCGHPSVRHPITGESPAPLVYFSDKLQWIEDEITEYYWRKNPLGMNMDEPIDGNDDAMNTLKYVIAPQPSPADIAVPEGELPPSWAYWHEMTPEQEAFDSNRRQ